MEGTAEWAASSFSIARARSIMKGGFSSCNDSSTVGGPGPGHGPGPNSSVYSDGSTRAHFSAREGELLSGSLAVLGGPNWLAHLEFDGLDPALFPSHTRGIANLLSRTTPPSFCSLGE